MSRWVIGALALLAALGVLALTGSKSVHAERVMPYPAQAIWAVLMDADGYGDWNPVLVRAEGRFEEGRTMRYRMRTADGGTAPVSPIVKRLADQRELNQFGGPPGVLTFDHTWRLEPVPGGTRVIQHEEYRGIGVWFWDPAWYEEAYRDGLAALEEHLGE